MKKQILATAICLLFVLFQGCSAPETKVSETKAPENTTASAPVDLPYTLYEESGKHYLKFNLEIPQIAKSLAGTQIFVQYPEFSTVSEMKERIETKDIPEDQLFALYQVNRKETIEIIDLDALYDVTLPTGLALRRILWYGDYYSFEADAGPYLGCVQVLSKQAYEKKFDLEYANYSYDKFGIVESQNLDERNATKVFFIIFQEHICILATNWKPSLKRFLSENFMYCKKLK